MIAVRPSSDGAGMMGSVERKAAARAKTVASEIPVAAGPQGTIAHRLRDERRKQGLSLDDVAEALRIRKTYIRAIESERFTELPGPAYALGFVGSYAQLLDLNRSVVVARFREEYAGVNTETELNFLVPLKEGRFPGRAVMVASIVLAIAVYGGWYAYSNNGTNSGANTPVVNTGPPANQPAGAKPAEAKPPKANPKAAASKADVTALLRHLRAVAETKQDAVVLNQRKSRPKLTKTTRAATRGNRAAARRAKARKGSAVKLAAAATPASGKARIILKALQDTWVRIQLADGTMVLSRILKAGESYAVLKNRGMVLTAGNAGGLRIVVDGRILPALGPKGAIRQGIRLDADELLASR